MRVAVVGGGIIGASVAWHLARGGAEVTVVQAGGDSATARSWAWINASWGGLTESYVHLRMASMTLWRDLAAVVPGVRPVWSGALIWDEEDLPAMVAARQAQGYAIRLVDGAEAARIEPALADPPALAAHAGGDGAVEAAEAAAALLADAAARDAGVVQGRAAGVALRSGKAAGVRLETSEVIEADAVVLAAGAATQALAAEAGVAAPVDDAPALLAWTEPVAPLLQGLVVGPGLELRQRADGRLLMAGDLQEDGPGASATALIDRVGRALRGGESLRLDGFAAGGRPIPADGLPLAGEAAPGLWLAVTHSGATLAPALGAMLAAEIITAKRDPLLLPFDARRFGAA